MILNLDRVKSKFSTLSGESANSVERRGRLCTQLCQECMNRAAAMFDRMGKAAGSHTADLLETWAAAEAYYQLSLVDESEDPERVSADGVEIVPGERSKKAKAFADEKLKELMQELREGDFCFVRA